MDTSPNQNEPLLCGAADSLFGIGPPLDETGLWLGEGEGEEGLLCSFEPGGALMNTGGWSISTFPGEEGLRWNGVKTEVFDELAAQTKETNSLVKPSAVPGASKTKSAPTGFLGVRKPEPEESWAEFVAASTGSAPLPTPSSRADVLAPGGTDSNSPPSLPAGNFRPALAITPAAPTTEVPASRPTLTRPAGPSPQQRVSPRVAAIAATVARTPAAAAASAAAAAAAATAAASPSMTVKVEPEDDEDEEGNDEDEEGRGRDIDSDEPGSELTDKRRRNREHAKRSRLRKRVRLGGLEEMVLGLRRENVRLRQIVKQGIPDRADNIIRTCARDNTNADIVAKQDVVQGMRPGMSVSSSSSSWNSRGAAAAGVESRARSKLDIEVRHHGSGRKGRRVPSALKLMSPCYQSVKALADSQANFILTNPNLPDCPIIFASQGFLDLTGYKGSQVIGKNCRFLQGPGTDPVTVSIIRNNLANGRDTSVCILNYKADGTPFWNQLSVGVLLDAHGKIANHIGVLYEVNQMPPAVFHRLLHRVPLPESLLNDELSDSGDDSSSDVKDRASAGQHGGAHSVSSTGPNPASSPRVVDRLRRTRAAAAIGNPSS